MVLDPLAGRQIQAPSYIISRSPEHTQQQTAFSSCLTDVNRLNNVLFNGAYFGICSELRVKPYVEHYKEVIVKIGLFFILIIKSMNF